MRNVVLSKQAKTQASSLRRISRRINITIETSKERISVLRIRPTWSTIKNITSSPRKKTLRNRSRITITTILIRTWITINHISIITLRITLMRPSSVLLLLSANIVIRNSPSRIYYILILRILIKNVFVNRRNTFFVTSARKFRSLFIMRILSKKLLNRSSERITLILITLFATITTL